MAEGRQRKLWDHTASIVATIVNVNRDPKKSPVPASRFHPFDGGRGRQRGIPITAENIGLLKAVFVDPPAGRAGNAGRSNE